MGLGPGDNLRGQVGQGGKGVRQADMGQEERYGMAGLLSLIQMTDPDLATLVSAAMMGGPRVTTLRAWLRRALNCSRAWRA